MKEANYEDVQEILRKVFGELYMFKNISANYQENKDSNSFSLQVKISKKESEESK